MPCHLSLTRFTVLLGAHLLVAYCQTSLQIWTLSRYNIQKATFTLTGKGNLNQRWTSSNCRLQRTAGSARGRQRRLSGDFPSSWRAGIYRFFKVIYFYDMFALYVLSCIVPFSAPFSYLRWLYIYHMTWITCAKLLLLDAATIQNSKINGQ